MKVMQNIILYSLILNSVLVHACDGRRLVVHKTKETLATIKEIIRKRQKGAYLRFGDGDINLAYGDIDMMQQPNKQLQREMREAYALNGPTILKTIPLYCSQLGGFEQGMFNGNHAVSYERCLHWLNKVALLWNAPIRDVYCHAALHFSSTQYQHDCIRFLRFLKNNNCCLLVGNMHIPLYLRALLFGKRCAFVPTPPTNAYAEIDRIERECLEHIPNDNEYKIIITAMGCSGRVLQKRLWNKLDNVFLFDFGSLMDALCGWSSRDWIKVTNFDAKNFIKKLATELKIICTAALIDTHRDYRKKEYIQSLEIIKSYGYEPYVIEAIQKRGPTFFDDYSQYVFYALSNNAALKNKGVNEAKTLLEGMKKFNFNDNDMILKLTGRYHFLSDAFIKLIEDNPDVDVFIKLENPTWVFTGCFAMRYHYLRNMLETLNYSAMERIPISLETEVCNYINKITQEKKVKIVYVNRLQLEATIYGDGKEYLTYPRRMIY